MPADVFHKKAGSIRTIMEYEKLYTRYGPMVYRRCLKLLGNEDEARDALQDVFVSVMSQRSRLDLSFPSSLLYRIATNNCFNRIRQRKRQVAGFGDDDVTQELVNQIVDAVDLEQQVFAVKLKEFVFGNQQQLTELIATLYLVDGMTLEEVAREVDMSVSGVRKRLRKLAAHVSELQGIVNED